MHLLYHGKTFQGIQESSVRHIKIKLICYFYNIFEAIWLKKINFLLVELLVRSPWYGIPRHSIIIDYQGNINSLSAKNIYIYKLYTIGKCSHNIFLIANGPWQTPTIFTANEPRDYIYLSRPNVQPYLPPLSQPMQAIQDYGPRDYVYPRRSYMELNPEYNQRNYGYSRMYGFNTQQQPQPHPHPQMRGMY